MNFDRTGPGTTSEPTDRQAGANGAATHHNLASPNLPVARTLLALSRVNRHGLAAPENQTRRRSRSHAHRTNQPEPDRDRAARARASRARCALTRHARVHAPAVNATGRPATRPLRALRRAQRRHYPALLAPCCRPATCQSSSLGHCDALPSLGRHAFLATLEIRSQESIGHHIRVDRAERLYIWPSAAVGGGTP